MKLAVTLDTEADGQWDYGSPLTTRNVAFWPPFQELCDRHGVTPTFLLTSEIMGDDRAREFLMAWEERDGCELGTHLHPWTTPPFADRPGFRRNDTVHAFPSQLPDDLHQEKLHNLTEQFVAAFGRRPTAYRAGRFGFNTCAARALVGEGYAVDSSVTPLWSWRGYPGLHGEGGPDVKVRSPEPFLIAGLGGGGLVELPVTIIPTYEPLRRHPELLAAYRSLPLRAVRRILLSRWLTPQPMWMTPDPRLTAQDLIGLWETAQELGLSTVMMFHSSELMPGGSPFRPDAPSVTDLLGCLDALFAHVLRDGGEPATLTGLAGHVRSRGRLEAKSL